MWLFTRSSFISMVADPDDPDCLIVRARVRGDIGNLWPSAVVEWTPRRDYKYRAKISRQEVVSGLGREVAAINYGNYKTEAGRKDRRRVPFLCWIWNIGGDMGDALEGRRGR